MAAGARDPLPTRRPARRSATARRGASGRALRDARGGGIAGLLGDLVAGGAPVLAVAAHAGHRAAALRDRVGGFAVTTWAALEADPALAAGYAHVVAVDPPPHAHLRALADAAARATGWTHLAWGGAELELARRVLAWELDLRAPLAERLPRAPRRRAGPPSGAVDGLGARWPPRSCAARGAQPRSGRRSPGRLLRVLAELGLVVLGDRAARGPRAAAPRRAPSSSARRRSARTRRACATGSRTRRAARAPAAAAPPPRQPARGAAAGRAARR